MEILGIQPNVVSYTAAIKSCEPSGDWMAALDMLDLMRLNNIKPNEVTYCCTISTASKGYAADVALSLLREMNAYRFPPNELCYGGVLHACARCRKWDEIERLVKEMRQLKVPVLESVVVSVIGACKYTLDQTSLASPRLEVSFSDLHQKDSNSVQWVRAIWLLKIFLQSGSAATDTMFTMCMVSPNLIDVVAIIA
jgi:pentatricopeptide repeat protein